MDLSYGTLTDSPLGPLSFVAGDHGLQRIVFFPLDSLKPANTILVSLPSVEGFLTINTVLVEINEFLNGQRKEFSIAIDWDHLGQFQRQVFAMTIAIPYGQVITYGAMAEKLGNPGAVRAVGRALGANPMPIVIPCHRVIASNFDLQGYSGGLDRKAFLLQLEGHRIEDGRLRFE